MALILIVEDETSINELIRRSLDLTGHTSLQAFTGREAISLAADHPVDLALLDVNLPDLDGFRLKNFLGEVPVIFVTARDQVTDRVAGLDSGAEDYIVKPFDMDELLARVRAVLRRFQKEQKVYAINGVTVDLERRTVTRGGEPVELTSREFELLKVLILHKNIALSRDKLLDNAWGADYEGDERTVDVHIQRLRKKLHLEEQIKTVFKLGYRLETPR